MESAVYANFRRFLLPFCHCWGILEESRKKTEDGRTMVMDTLEKKMYNCEPASLEELDRLLEGTYKWDYSGASVCDNPRGKAKPPTGN